MPRHVVTKAEYKLRIEALESELRDARATNDSLRAYIGLLESNVRSLHQRLSNVGILVCKTLVELIRRRSPLGPPRRQSLFDSSYSEEEDSV